jgi:hypothetical protein
MNCTRETSAMSIYGDTRVLHCYSNYIRGKSGVVPAFRIKITSRYNSSIKKTCRSLSHLMKKINNILLPLCIRAHAHASDLSTAPLFLNGYRFGVE